jgi:predicted nucleic acid-binding protein
MIYLDTSVALAQLLGEDRRPPARLWREALFSSRLLEYEVWNRVHARKIAHRHHEAVSALLEQVSLIELSPAVLSRALQAFPSPVRTLDALHLATLDFLRANGRPLHLASYDERLNAVATKMKFKLFDAG